MNKKVILIILMAVHCSVIFAQNKEAVPKKRSCSCGFSSINNVGFMEGGNGSSFLLQTINGFRYKTWFIGAGVGLEYYQLRGIPVFLDLRKNILQKPTSPFIYADYGMHYAWPRDKDKESWQIVDFKNGTYYDVGVGYHVSIKKSNALLFSIGYSYKYLEKTTRYISYCPYTDCPDQVDSYKYKLNRLSLKAGWQF